MQNCLIMQNTIFPNLAKGFVIDKERKEEDNAYTKCRDRISRATPRLGDALAEKNFRRAASRANVSYPGLVPSYDMGRKAVKVFLPTPLYEKV